MKTSRIFLTITMLALVILVFTGCQGVVPTPSPGATEDVTVISGRIKMPLTCCAPEGVYTESSDKDCDEAELWPFVPNAVVELKSAAKGKCKTVLATTLTDEEGNYLFEDIKPGLYIITAYCPEEAKKGFFLKDVAEKLHGVALDAGIPDCTSTALALVIEKVNNCYNDWYHCYNKLTKVYKLIETIAKDVGKVDIAAIMNHNSFGDYCDDVYDDLVDLVCDFGCCASPGTTGGGGGGGPTPDPCAGHSAPYEVELDNLFATVGEVYTGTVTAKDADNDTLSFAFATEGYTPPNGMTIDSSTGVITWDSPTVDDICVCETPKTTASSKTCSPIQITVSDRCHSTEAQFCLAVEDAPRYHVYYDGNTNTGGTAPTDSSSYYEGDGATVLDKGLLTKANHHFTGWNTKADGTGTAYAANGNLTMPDHDVTLYAQWEEIIIPDYTLILNVNPEAGGTVSGAGTYSAGTIANISATPNEGWKFTGWTVNTGSSSNVGNTGSANTNITMNEDMTLTANFVLDIYQQGGNLTVAYEDLPKSKDSDYDYNDWVVSIKIEANYEGASNLKSIIFDFTPKARGAGNDHEFYIKIPRNTFANNGTYSLVISGDTGSNNGTFYANSDMEFKVIPDTRRSLGNESGNTTNTVETSQVPPTVTAKLTITFGTSFPYDFSKFDPYSATSMHGEGLFFDPYINVKPAQGGSSYSIHKGDNRILTVPDDWKWPEEGRAIWKVYNLVSQGSAPNYVIFNSAWWQGGHNNCVYGDGVTCSLP